MNRSTQIIGLTGPKQSGKSTVAGLLTGFSRMSFAAPLKRMLLAMGVTPAEMEDKEAVIPRFDRSPRFLMQTLGTEWGRNIVAQTLWLDITQAEATHLLSIGQSVVFDDVRFDNEAILIKNMGGVIWKICPRAGELSMDGHVSEHGINPSLIDERIANFGTTDDLKETVFWLIQGKQGALRS